jgi:hypothetical protein
VVVVVVVVVIVIVVVMSGISSSRNQAPHHKDLCNPGTWRQTYEHPVIPLCELPAGHTAIKELLLVLPPSS